VYARVGPTFVHVPKKNLFFVEKRTIRNETERKTIKGEVMNAAHKPNPTGDKNETN